jgi:membrane protease YdiL (CAAX protease family)
LSIFVTYPLIPCRLEQEILPAFAAAEQPAYPTIAESWGALGWYVLISVLLALVVWLPLNTALHLTGGGRTAVLLGIAQLTLILTLVWLRNQKGLIRWPGLVLSEQPQKWQLFALLPVLVLAQAVLLTALSFLHLPNWSSALFQSLSASPVLAFAMGCVGAPILEEALFRGILLKGLLRNYPPRMAILQSAVLFGVFHFNPAQSVTATIIGLLLGWLYYRTRSLAVCMVLHGLNNLLALSLLQLPPAWQDEYGVLSRLGGIGGYLLVLLVAAGVVLGSIWWVYRTTSTTHELAENSLEIS